MPVVVVQHNDQGDHRLAKGQPGWELRPEIAPLPGEVLVHKTACDSFFETDLQAQAAGTAASPISSSAAA